MTVELCLIDLHWLFIGNIGFSGTISVWQRLWRKKPKATAYAREVDREEVRTVAEIPGPFLK